MRRLTILGALVVALAVAATAAAKPPTKPAKASKPTITKTHAPKGSAAKGATMNGSASKGSTVKTKAKGTQPKASHGKSVKLAKTDAKVAKADVKTAKAERKATKKTTVASNDTSSTTSTSTNGTAGDTNTPAGAIDFSATALGQKLQKNSALRSKIEAKLMAAGYTGSVYEAAFGFKNLGQLNAATNQVQNHGYSFELLKVLMTGTYVDPETHLVYRANRLPDGTVQLVSPELAAGTASTLSLGQAKQAIAGGAVMPEVVVPVTQPGGGSF
jgi:hypothetical protein